MKGRKLIMAFVGATQEAVGVLTIAFSYVLHSNLFNVQTWLKVPEEEVSLCLVPFFVFGFVSIISGFFLLRELPE